MTPEDRTEIKHKLLPLYHLTAYRLLQNTDLIRIRYMKCRFKTVKPCCEAVLIHKSNQDLNTEQLGAIAGSILYALVAYWTFNSTTRFEVKVWHFCFSKVTAHLFGTEFHHNDINRAKAGLYILCILARSSFHSLSYSLSNILKVLILLEH